MLLMILSCYKLMCVLTVTVLPTARQLVMLLIVLAISRPKAEQQVHYMSINYYVDLHNCWVLATARQPL